MKRSDMIVGLLVLLSCLFFSVKSEDNTTTESLNAEDDSNFDSYYETFEKYYRFNLTEQNINCVIKMLKQENILVRFSQETLNDEQALIANLNVFLEAIQQQKLCGGDLTENEEKILGNRLMSYITRWKNDAKESLKLGQTYTEKVDYCLFNKMRLEKSEAVKSIERKLFSGGTVNEEKVYKEEFKIFLTNTLGSCYSWYDVICYGKFSPTKTIVDYIGSCVNYLKPPYLF